MRILLTGSEGFTGKYLTEAALAAGHEVVPLTCDLTDPSAVKEVVSTAAPTHVLHLAGISAVTHSDELAFYQVNLFGTLNLLKALSSLPYRPTAIVLASTATVYGNAAESPIAESAVPQPVSHYAVSKLAMEFMARTYLDRLPIVIARPFNYTGVGQDARFVIPKIVSHFARQADTLELGNLAVAREFNDVRMVCDAYLRLLEKGVSGEVYNLCSGRPVSLMRVIEILEGIARRKIRVTQNPAFVRENEVYRLCGDPTRLQACIGPLVHLELEDTLRWMYEQGRAP